MKTNNNFDNFERVENAAKDFIRAIVWESRDVAVGESEDYIEQFLNDCNQNMTAKLIENVLADCKKKYDEGKQQSDLRSLFVQGVDDKRKAREKRIAEGKAKEKAWLERTQAFFSKIEFLNEYGFQFYISVEKESGWCSYEGQQNIYIRSHRTHGYINVYPDGTIHNESCFTSMYGSTYKSAEEFVKDMTKCIR